MDAMTDRGKEEKGGGGARSRIRYVPAVGPRLRRLLAVIFFLFALLVVNSVYLVTVTVAGARYQNWFYLNMFLLHLVLGLLIIVPVIVFGVAHIRNAHNRPNRRAVRVGYALFTTALLTLGTGLLLTRVDLLGYRFDLSAPLARQVTYWLHVAGPVGAIWLFILHRLAGRRIRWKVGAAWAAVAAVFAAAMLILQTQDPRSWNTAGPASGQQYFFPSLARTSTGNFIPADVLQNDAYCLECHADIHRDWSHSAHRLSSFNNPAYLFSVLQTRQAMMERDGDVQASRFCAGCHDPVPFFSGAFDEPRFDDPDYDLARDAMAQAGITCTSCHAITHVNSVQGNADYTIEEPIHYPFTFSDSRLLRWVNRQLVKAKPEFHRATFLKPLHKTTEFCGTCHKVHLPPELNGYKWLRGQNHYDSFWLSGVSGHGLSSFYYPAVAEANCNRCHMPLVASDDFGAQRFETNPGEPLYETLAVHGHQFVGANTGVLHLLRESLDDADGAIAAHREFLEDSVRIDVFGLREGGTVDGALLAPICSEEHPLPPALAPGATYLLETVVRTLRLGHDLTEGTADSNELWLEVTLEDGDSVIGRSGGLDPDCGDVDAYSHFINAFVIDRDGNRIDRRNAEDIFVALYNNQIPPGASDVIHYRFRVPEGASGPITATVRLRYRKFDTTFMRHVTGDPDYVNDLPIVTMAEATVVFPVAGVWGGAGAGVGESRPDQASTVADWERWNDYGIGLLRREGPGELRQAAVAFAEVERLGRADGPLNLARLYIREGLVQTDAPEALARAAAMAPPAPAWSLLWFGAQVAAANGDYDRAIANLREIMRGGFAAAVSRGFDFSKDYRGLNALAAALYQRALLGPEEERRLLMEAARDWYEHALALDPENLAAHWGLKQVFRDLGDAERESHHTARHARYKPDDNARDAAVAAARLRYPAANLAAEAIVIYDLQRSGAYGLTREANASDD